MKENTIHSMVLILLSFIAIFVVLLALLLAYGMTLVVIESKQGHTFCSNNYPSEIVGNYVGFDKESSNMVGIEEGYIKCCRMKYQNHIREKECKVFEYRKQKV